MTASRRQRPLIAFFDYADVFEDFYPRYGIDQRSFASWTGSGNHAFLSLIQREVGDVVWYVLSLQPQAREMVHEGLGCRIKFLRTSLVHRTLWHAFYEPRASWRWRRAYRAYATVASYTALASLELLRELRRDRPDVLFLQSYSSGRFDVLLAAARMLGVPLGAYHAGGLPEGYLGSAVRRWTLPRADLLLVSSASELEMLTAKFRVPRMRVRVVLTPIDTVRFRPMPRDEACRLARLDPSRRYLLYVGRLDDPVKRVPDLVQAFADVAPTDAGVDLLIVGAGREHSELEQRARAAVPGRAHFLGRHDDPDQLAALYNSAECLLLWSTREGFPTVVGEAMACGTPVLASDVGGVQELVTEGVTGWTVPPNRPEILRLRLGDVIAEPELARSMRPACREVAQQRVAPEVVGEQLRESFAGLRTSNGHWGSRGS